MTLSIKKHTYKHRRVRMKTFNVFDLLFYILDPLLCTVLMDCISSIKFVLLLLLQLRLLLLLLLEKGRCISKHQKRANTTLNAMYRRDGKAVQAVRELVKNK